MGKQIYSTVHYRFSTLDKSGSVTKGKPYAVFLNSDIVVLGWLICPLVVSCTLFLLLSELSG